jgi:hypothetical protein
VCVVLGEKLLSNHQAKRPQHKNNTQCSSGKQGPDKYTIAEALAEAATPRVSQALAVAA